MGHGRWSRAMGIVPHAGEMPLKLTGPGHRDKGGVDDRMLDLEI